MIRVRRDPALLLLLCVPVLIFCWLRYPSERVQWQLWATLIAFFGVFRFAFWVFRRMNPPPVPDVAVRALLEKCPQTWQQQGEEWFLIRFQPRVSLCAARRKVGRNDYSDEERVHGFMMKFAFVAPARLDCRVFYSSDKGILYAHLPTVRTLEKKYGRWMLDSWYTLAGALARERLSVCGLDGGQVFSHGQYLGSTDSREE